MKSLSYALNSMCSINYMLSVLINENIRVMTLSFYLNFEQARMRVSQID